MILDTKNDNIVGEDQNSIDDIISEQIEDKDDFLLPPAVKDGESNE